MMRTSSRESAPPAADGLNLSAFQKPQQLSLHLQAHLPDFVEEERALMRLLQTARPVTIRAGEAALGVAEQLGFEQRFRKGRAVDGHERRAERADRA